MAKLHPVVAEVTDRIREKSRKTRADYLRRMNERITLRESTVAEIGPGWLGIGLLAFSLFDAARIHAFDHLPHLRFSLVKGLARIAYDNLEWSPLVEPPLTCVSPPRYDMGVAAGQMIVSLIERRPVESPRVLATQMVTRRSCGCAWSPLDERRGIET